MPIRVSVKVRRKDDDCWRGVHEGVALSNDSTDLANVVQRLQTQLLQWVALPGDSEIVFSVITVEHSGFGIDKEK